MAYRKVTLKTTVSIQVIIRDGEILDDVVSSIAENIDANQSVFLNGSSYDAKLNWIEMETLDYTIEDVKNQDKLS